MSTPPLDCIPTLPALPPCEHIAGNEKFALKAFSLQTKHMGANGRSRVDVTLDLEDGAPVGQEECLRTLFVRLLRSPENVAKQCGIRIHPTESEHAVRDLEVLISEAGDSISYITVPKVQGTRDVLWVRELCSHFLRRAGHARSIPLHLLIETSEALRNLNSIASISGIETLDFGLMDFISQLGGGISADCMISPGQFDNQLLRTTKSAIALAALGNNIIPSHNVTVDVRNPQTAYSDALRARTEFGFLRMWSIHPDQIEPILQAMSPATHEVIEAHEILAKAEAAKWGPIQHAGRLHDRASYRYYWGILRQSGAIHSPPPHPLT